MERILHGPLDAGTNLKVDTTCGVSMQGCTKRCRKIDEGDDAVFDSACGSVYENRTYVVGKWPVEKQKSVYMIELDEIEGCDKEGF